MKHNCASCGRKAIAFYDDHFEEYFCDAQCHRDYCSTGKFDEIYDIWAEQNLEEVNE